MKVFLDLESIFLSQIENVETFEKKLSSNTVCKHSRKNLETADRKAIWRGCGVRDPFCGVIVN